MGKAFFLTVVAVFGLGWGFHPWWRSTSVPADAGGTHAALAQYQWPLAGRSGVTGTFGELRPNHFHMGIDIRTGYTPLPVKAAADGHVARIKVSHTSYGRAIYLRHAYDSNTTVYAHLSRFAPAIQAYVEKLQYSTRSWDQELFPGPAEFVFKKGDILGYTGNSGLSAGPHLHYEVRDVLERIMNPLAFHPDAVPDPDPPFFTRVAFEPLGLTSRVNKTLDKLVLTPRELSPDTYSYDDAVEVEGPVGVELMGYDRLPGSRGYNGLYRLEMYLDDTLYVAYGINRFSFDQVRQILQFTDFAYQQRNGQFLQKLYRDTGLDVPFFTHLKNNGALHLTDYRMHHLRIVAYDIKGNHSTFSVRIRRSLADSRGLETVPGRPKADPYHTVRRGVLRIWSTLPATTAGTVATLTYPDSSERNITALYSDNGYLHWALDITEGPLPVKATSPAWTRPVYFSFQGRVDPSQPSLLGLGRDLELSFPPGVLFERTPLAITLHSSSAPYVVSPVYTVGVSSQPVLGRYNLHLRLNPNPRAANYRPQQIVLCQKRGVNNYSRVAGEYRVGTDYYGQANTFGEFCLVADTSGPRFVPLNFKSGAALGATQDQLLWAAGDNVAGIHPAKMEVLLDGRWHVAEYNSYRGELLLTFREKPARGLHSVVISATDYAGNQTAKVFSFRVL